MSYAVYDGWALESTAEFVRGLRTRERPQASEKIWVRTDSSLAKFVQRPRRTSRSVLSSVDSRSNNPPPSSYHCCCRIPHQENHGFPGAGSGTKKILEPRRSFEQCLPKKLSNMQTPTKEKHFCKKLPLQRPHASTPDVFSRHAAGAAMLRGRGCFFSSRRRCRPHASRPGDVLSRHAAGAAHGIVPPSI